MGWNLGICLVGQSPARAYAADLLHQASAVFFLPIIAYLYFYRAVINDTVFGE